MVTGNLSCLKYIKKCSIWNFIIILEINYHSFKREKITITNTDVKFTFMYNVKIGFKDFNLAFSSFSYSLLWRLPSNFVTVCYLKCCLHWYGIIIIITTEKTISEFLRKINILMKEKQAREIMTSSYSWSESPHSPKQQLDVTPNSLIVTLLQNQ